LKRDFIEFLEIKKGIFALFKTLDHKVVFFFELSETKYKKTKY